MKHDSWPKVQLQAVCEHITVGHVGPMAKQYTATGIPFLRSQNVRPFKFDPTEIKFISREFHAALKKSALRPNDVVVTRSGANTGQCCIIPPQLTDANCADLVILRPSERINPWFLMYVLNSDWGRATIAGGVVGAAQHHFNIGVARQFAIALPPLPLQCRIADILSAYDDLIENNQRRIKILEEMARSLYREWFVHFRFPGHGKVKMVPSPLGPIPQGWDVACLSALVDFAKGRKPSETRKEPLPGNVSLLLIDALRGGEAEFASPAKLIIAEARDTIMVMDGASSCEVAIGFSGAVGSTLGRFRTTKPNVFSPHALYRFLEMKAEEFKSKNIGAAIPHANKDYILRQFSALPPEDIACQFDDQLEPIQGTIEILKAKIQNLRRTRDLLLPRLLSGQLIKAVS